MFAQVFNKYISSDGPPRYLGLDLLRALAVVGVILCHSDTTLPFSLSGWAGVDLFFVLSGFLVTGLLITEYQQSRNIDKRRFFIRRSFKILPPFYVFLVVSCGYLFLTKGSFPSIQQLLIELGFVQSYYDSIWGHTWTLAVEEQFYLLLLLIFSFLLPLKLLDKPHAALILVILLLLGVWTARILHVLAHSHQETTVFFQTHLRADGLLVGTLFSFLFHYYPGFRATIQRKRILWLIVASACIAPLFFFPGGSFFMNTWGLCLLHFGFALLVILSLDLQPVALGTKLFRRTQPLFKVLAIIGFHSYSVYLWHLMIKNLAYTYLPSGRIAVWSYLLFSVVLGVAMSVLVEQRFLAIRERFFPRINKRRVIIATATVAAPLVEPAIVQQQKVIM